MTDWRRTVEALLTELITKEGGPRPQQVCTACAGALEADRASIAVILGEVRHTVCATDPVAGDLDELQFTVGEGPCLEACVSGAMVVATDLHAARARWPMFISGLQEYTERTGVRIRTMLGLPLRVRTESPGGEFLFGALNLHYSLPVSVDQALIERASAAADAAALAVLGVLPGGRELGADWWTHEGDLRRSVHQATGLIAEQLGLPPEDALARLRMSAFAHGQTSRERAEEILAARRVTEEDL